MARSEFEADSASCQFFWLLFDSDLTPAGESFCHLEKAFARRCVGVCGIRAFSKWAP